MHSDIDRMLESAAATPRHPLRMSEVMRRARTLQTRRRATFAATGVAAAALIGIAADRPWVRTETGDVAGSPITPEDTEAEVAGESEDVLYPQSPTFLRSDDW